MVAEPGGLFSDLSLVGGLELEGASDLITSRKVSSNQRQDYGDSVCQQTSVGKGGEKGKQAHTGV